MASIGDRVKVEDEVIVQTPIVWIGMSSSPTGSPIKLPSGTKLKVLAIVPARPDLCYPSRAVLFHEEYGEVDALFEGSVRLPSVTIGSWDEECFKIIPKT